MYEVVLLALAVVWLYIVELTIVSDALTCNGNALYGRCAFLKPHSARVAI